MHRPVSSPQHVRQALPCDRAPLRERQLEVLKVIRPLRLSRSFLPVLKESPSDAQIVSHKLMLRAGLVRQTAAGIYAWLPAGLRVLRMTLEGVGSLSLAPASSRP